MAELSAREALNKLWDLPELDDVVKREWLEAIEAETLALHDKLDKAGVEIQRIIDVYGYADVMNLEVLTALAALLTEIQEKP
jgi:metal-dependent HD superfamily phosphatase/phosphodiesterase